MEKEITWQIGSFASETHLETSIMAEIKIRQIYKEYQKHNMNAAHHFQCMKKHDPLYDEKAN